MLPDWQIRLLAFPPENRPEALPVVFVPPKRLEEYGPVLETQIQPASLDVRLGGDFINHKTGEEVGLDPFHQLTMMPGDCWLACLVERFFMPDNVVARVEGKSSWARKFLTVHSAGFIDPGFRGDITMELKNDGHHPIHLVPGAPIAQVSFQRLDAPASRPYGSESLGSHYQYQQGATRSWLG